MKIKASELIDLTLDWAVAKCEGYSDYCPETEKLMPPRKEYGWVRLCDLNYSTDWAQGGPIIELNEIGSFHYIHGYRGPTWSASIGSGGFQQDGPTPLIAAMRCYVASKLGDEVDVPDILLSA